MILMKKYSFAILALVSTFLSGCSDESGPDKFVGKWQSIKVAARPPLTIEKRGDVLIVGEGKSGEFPATYDKENKKLTINVPMAGALDIVYLADKDHILITQDGEYSRVE